LLASLNEYLSNPDPFRKLWPPSWHLCPKVRAFADFMIKSLFVPAPHIRTCLSQR